ncbi:uncharacterized protein MONOS_7676 [Monocercomonoides exilis]|uniref:uncharacterized protein n=1 Tax=Monocercomonoides exilis TaxID=2049356 RepID=UPI0035598532|nr:hypothetical protein MONOS_7676 [Monocercomonoides exilis]|eukprot:MONOS_7676.1-p1 / transcript=MONOS_7676.1 / gene=MONOS_7676 / organism=Monocercomonoides_exilis_PA203 / gene_product=unspecified product / transcript_product=unspecified product / location=Mono_scaffold00268:52421-53196(-) / protein_length=142 / sequence_SO=supercontig / SO=protein_coding / is_pseudo=false
MWDLTIITKWAESTYDAKDIRILQRRALILTMIFGALRPADLERMRRETTIFKDNSVQTQVRTKTSGDTNWILETICGPVLQGGEENKPDRSGDTKEGTLEIAEADSKDHTDESPKSGLEEGKKPTRKRSKRRESFLKDGG